MMNNRLNILGVGVHPVRFDEAIKLVKDMMMSEAPHHIVTVNPEFVLYAQKDVRFREVLNNADLATADGFGIRLAATFLRQKITWIPVVREVQIFLQGFWVGCLSIFNRNFLKDIPELVTGADLIWALAKVAEEQGYTVYFLDRQGGLGTGTPQKAAHRLQESFPRLKVVGAESVNPDHPGFMRHVAEAKPDLLFVGFGFPRQEFFIAENKNRLGIKVAIGIGGALDYIAGVRPRPPRILRGRLEWLWRLIIPSGHSISEYLHRAKRILTAAILFPWSVFIWKLRWGSGLEQIKAIIFDFGGVLNENGVETIIKQAWRVVPVHQLPVLALFYWRFIPQLERGAITEEVVWRYFSEYFGHDRDLLALRSKIINGFIPHPKIWQLVRRLRQKSNLKLALLSNNIKEWMEIWERRHHLSHYFSPLIASCFVGIRKPNAAIFKLLIQKLNLPPQQIVFVDDHYRNTLQARRLGIKAVVCRQPDICAKDLEEILR